jgi:hypothetical protein
VPRGCTHPPPRTAEVGAIALERPNSVPGKERIEVRLQPA